MKQECDTVVVGAGISGIAAALTAQSQHLDTMVLERRDRVGGCLRTVAREGFRAELGPLTVRQAPALLRLAELVGMGTELSTTSSGSTRRWVFTDDRLVALPTGPRSLVTTPLLSAWGRLRVLAERWIRGGAEDEESVRDFFSRRFGSEAGPKIADLAVTGIYAGRAEELEVALAFPSLIRMERTHGSLLRGLGEEGRGGLLRARHGWQAFAERLTDGLTVHLRTGVEALRRTASAFQVELDDGRTVRARRVVSTVPAPAAAAILRPLGPTEALAQVAHAPVVSLALGWRGALRLPEGFGLLVDRSLGSELLGVVFTDRLIPDAVPPGATLLTLLLGGRARPALIECSDQEITTVAARNLERILGRLPRPEFVELCRWRPGLPQPTSRLRRARASARALEEQNPGLHVIGSWRSGPAVGECAAAGVEATG